VEHSSPTLAEMLSSELAAPGNGAGLADIAAPLARLAKWARKVEAWCLGVASVSGFAALICFANWWPTRDQSSDSWYAGIALLVVMFVALMMPQVLWRRLYRGSILGWRPKILDDPVLAPTYDFIARCANCVIKAETHLGERIDKNFFCNILAPLLLSDFAEDRLLVRSAIRRRNYEAQLRVVSVAQLTGGGQSDAMKPGVARLVREPVALPTATDIGLGIARPNERLGEDEPPLKNHSPDIQWLVGGMRNQFGLGLESYLDTLAPSKVPWHRIVFEVGRRELRKGGGHGAQADAIRQIIAALKAAGLKYPDIDKGDATTTIKLLLSGRSGTKDITGHFCRDDPTQLQKTGVSLDENG
jgi:hypothetical protein